MKHPRLLLTLTITIACSLLLATTIHSSTTRIHLPYVPNRHIIATATPTATSTAPPTNTPRPTATATTPAGPCPCHADLRNCSDFATQALAQACFDHCWALTGRDIHRLDSDGDGIACESLP